MGRLIDEDDAINAILREYNKDDTDYPTDYQQGLHAAKKIIEQLPSAQADWEEMMVVCDNCGHAIHVKRIERREQ